MYIIDKMAITDANLVSSNVTENDYAAWNSGTTYALGDFVILTSTHKIYKSLQASNTNHDPTTSPTWWADQGSTNRWKMFDEIVSTQTSRTSPITVVIDCGRINSLALVNLSATSANVVITDTVDSSVVYDKTIDLVEYPAPDWYSYFYSPFSAKTAAVFSDIPPFSTARATITITNTAGNAACGICVMGMLLYLGDSDYGSTSVRNIDYSRKDVDEFGNYVITKRRFAKLIKTVLNTSSTRTDYINRVLSEYRSTPVMWIGDTSGTFDSLIVYGFYKDFETVLTDYTESTCTLEIEGLI